MGLAALTIAVLVATRFLALDADPPLWLPDAAVMDEALWADGARGKALFDDWYADDTGNAWLAAPVYNLLVWLSYSLFGVSLWSTRLVPASASLLLVALVGALVGRRSGARRGWAAALVLGLCPFLWAHGRFGLLEVPQAMFVAAAFALLLAPRRPGVVNGLAAGIAMAFAVGVKPNTIYFGVLPVGAAWLVFGWLDGDRWRAARPGRWLQAGAAVMGGCLGLAALAAAIGPARWNDVWITWHHEGGLGTTSVGDHLLRLGFVGSREAQAGRHAVWGLLRSAPVLCAAVWCALLHAVLRGPRDGDGSTNPSATSRALGGRAGELRHPAISPWEGALLAWAAVAFCAAEFSYTSAARRAVHLVVPMALFAAAWWARGGRAGSVHDLMPRCSVGRRLALWALLSAPVGVAIKPALANALRGVVRPWFGGDPDATLVAGAAGLLVLAVWGLSVVALTLATRRSAWPVQIARFALSRCARPALVLFLVVEIAMLGTHLWRPRFTVVEAQRAVQSVVREGEVVFGHMAPLLVQGKRVRAIRWVRAVGPGYAGPRPNPDAFERFDPDYILTHVSAVDRRAAEPAYALVVEGKDPEIDARFEPVLHVQMCTEPGDYPRWILQLWRRVR